MKSSQLVSQINVTSILQIELNYVLKLQCREKKKQDAFVNHEFQWW